MPTDPRPADYSGASTSLESGRAVIRTEAEALTLLADGLDENFVAAVDAILAAQGRVICSGMGKSGHIACKIAATMASTGTPAQFVHPAEASHGDLGMVTEKDVALVLSNSGETRELADIIAHCKRFRIPLIGVASRRESTLLRAADIALVLPAAPEACSVGMAPTTSTTMTLALGDALAVALMERRSFTPDRFRVFHPGGKLGAQLVSVRELMAKGDALPLIPDDAPMGDAVLAMSEKGFGVAGTVDAAGNLTGIITDGDLRRNMEGLLERRAADVATRNPKTITPDALAQSALAEMTGRITCLFVCEEGSRRPLGLIHVHDCLRAGVDRG